MDKKLGLKKIDEIEQQRVDLSANQLLLETKKSRNSLAIGIMGVIAILGVAVSAPSFAQGIFEIYAIICAVASVASMPLLAYKIIETKKINTQINDIKKQKSKLQKEKQHILDNIDLQFEDSYSITIPAKQKSIYSQTSQTVQNSCQPEQ